MIFENKKIELYGEFFELSQEKVKTNIIRIKLLRIASDWQKKINNDFFKLFSNFDDLYKNSDDLADQIRSESINEGMKLLATYDIYGISEKQFYHQFMEPYDSWDQEFDLIASQYESIVERTAELDAHRTARRKNRSQWVGYGSRDAIYDADAKNLVSNVEHGFFNLMAKGFTAIANSVKKDEIFKSSTTIELIANGSYNIGIAAFHATVDAINSEKHGFLHNYSDNETSKATAIIENINKSRIPKEKILSSLINSIECYPYNRDAYLILLNYFGGDNCHLDAVVNYFGIESLIDEKNKLLNIQYKKYNIASLDSLKANRHIFEKYAKYICHDDFQKEYEQLIQSATNIDANKNNDFTYKDNKPPTKESIDRSNFIDRPYSTNKKESGHNVKLFDVDMVIKNFSSDTESNFYVSPNLPIQKIKNFIEKNKFQINEKEILFFFDDTVFGKGDIGVIIDFNNVNVKLPFEEEHCTPLKAIKNIEINGFLNKKITLKLQNGERVDLTLTQSNKGANLLYEAIRKIMHSIPKL